MSSEGKPDHKSIPERFDDVKQVEEVLQEAARQAILEHARAGLKIAVWRDNRVVWEDAVVDENAK